MTDNLKPIELILLPTNTTCKFQPMDQWVISSLKGYYKTLALQRLVVAINKGKDLPVFSILDAMKMLDLAWQKVKTSIIVNCFAKAGISKDQQKSAKSDDDDPFRDLQNQIKKLGEFYPPDTTAEDVVSGDKNVVCTVPLLTDEELIEEMNNEKGDDADNGKDDDDAALLNPVCPKVSDIWKVLQVLHDHMPSVLAMKIFDKSLTHSQFWLTEMLLLKWHRVTLEHFFNDI